jgi:hypothetical protein
MDSSVPANNIGSGNVEKFDPVLIAKPLKRLRDIIGSPINTKLSKEKSRGI